MSLALEEHRLTGQSIARILTSQKLVNEADLMWGMAQEMGSSSSTSTAEHRLRRRRSSRNRRPAITTSSSSQLDDGVPLVAASNPTDVFAMDDLRTIIGRNFITVVATRYADQHLHRPGLSPGRRRHRGGHGGLLDFDETFDEGL